MIKGIFNKAQLKDFLYPLEAISSNFGTHDGIVLRFNKETKDIEMNSYNATIVSYAFIHYTNIINSFHVDDEKIGISNINDCIKYFSIINEDNTEIEYKDNEFFIKGTDAEFSFKTADVEQITSGKKLTIKDPKWLSEFEVDNKFETLKKAIKALSAEENVTIKGVKDEGKIYFTVNRPELDINKFKCSISSVVNEDFEYMISKDKFCFPLNVKCDKMIYKIAPLFVCCECISPNYNIKFFIAKKAAKG